MPTTIDREKLLSTLAHDEQVREDPFRVLQSISIFCLMEPESEFGAELVLRALDVRDAFGGYQEILNELIRQVGLFPYLNPAELEVQDQIAIEFHRAEGMKEATVFHRAQSSIHQQLMSGKNVVLSAPTSFGKSLIVDAVIASKMHRNIAIVVPTLALIDETRRRLSVFASDYKLISQTTQLPAERNLFIFTAERILAYQHMPDVDFFVIDEFYKIGEIEGHDTKRMVALNKAFYRLWAKRAQFYLLGPNIRSVPAELEEKLNCQFINTDFKTVVSEVTRIKAGKTKAERGAELVRLVKTLNEPTLIFSGSPAKANVVAEKLNAELSQTTKLQSDLADWLAVNYHPDWIVVKALRCGIGIHHGKLPRAIAQQMTRLFDDGKITTLICTSTLIAGVNTKAKNVVVFDSKIMNKKITHFTFNNIKGRSGRMFKHFIGRVFLFDPPPEPTLPFVDFPFLTQGEDAPSDLLVEIDFEDLSDVSKERMQPLFDQSVLPLDIIRQNEGIDPQWQIELAEAIAAAPARHSQALSWSGVPDRTQLSFACDLIWDYFVRSKKRVAGVSSAKQLAFKISKLRDETPPRQLAEEELSNPKYAAKDANEAVERVLDFERTWATFDFPRLLMSLSRIQESVLLARGLPAGNFSFFSQQVETVFRGEVVKALDEFGIPWQMAQKLTRFLPVDAGIDECLKILTDLPTDSTGLTEFENDVFEFAKTGFGI